MAHEQPAVRTTIVGGRPPGSGQGIGSVPRGIEVLLMACLSVQAVAGEAPAPAPAPAAKAEAIDLTREGSYASGVWTYRLRFINAGTRSQATVGSLMKDGVELPAPTEAKPVPTPWGPMIHLGKRGDLETGGKPWGDFGWRPAPPVEVEGKKRDRLEPEVDPKGHIKEGSQAEEDYKKR